MNVVPHVGTWIEIGVRTLKAMLPLVVPHVGTWIEMMVSMSILIWLRRASRRHVD